MYDPVRVKRMLESFTCLVKLSVNENRYKKYSKIRRRNHRFMLATSNKTDERHRAPNSTREAQRRTMDEESALLGRRKRKSGTNDRFKHISRVMTVAVLAALSVASVLFELHLSSLSTALQQEKHHVEELESTIQIHQQIINRFNASVTNTDVLDRMKELEKTLSDTRGSLETQLQETQTSINRDLKNTLETLNETVDMAKEEIQQEVDKVKKDVEQYVMDTQDQFSMENSFMVYQIAGTFTLFACLISMWHMTAHLRKMNQPDVQRKILAILWMSPIYAITSWFSLVFHSAEGYLAIIKDGYEAYIIYQFLSFLIAVLGKGDREKVVDLLARRADHLTPPFRLFGCFELCCSCCRPEPFESPRALANSILLQCQTFALQFVFFRPLTTTAMVILKELDYYGMGTGPADYRSPQFYITIVQNISIFTAFTGLLKFYHAVDKDLAWCRPFAKFLCIKGVVFMTFWQGLTISILAQTTDVGGKDSEEWAASAQNFFICLEMLLFSIAHFYCFPTDEWEDGYRIKHSGGKFGDSIALSDFFSDVKLILMSGGSTSKQKHKTSSKQTLSEPVIPESDDHEEEDDVNTDGMSQATSSEDIDDEEKVKRALEQSLGVAADDPEIEKAKQRLLESNILSPEFFDEVDLNNISDEAVRELHKAGISLDDFDDSEDESELEDLEYVTEHIGQDSNESTPPRQEGRVATSESPNETTRLVSQIIDPPTPLRPSIFTTVASLAESETG